MVDLPISDYIKNYYQERNITFDDFTQATIIWNSHLSWQERIAMLRELAEDTTDEGLKLQIEERVNYELQELALFYKNPDRKYIYKVTDCEDDSDLCYFTTVEKAFAYGRETCEDEIKLVKIIVDPEDNDDEEAYCYWDHSGSVIRYFDSYTSNMAPEDTHGKAERFEMAFIHCEYPFERGDIVRHVVTGDVGVLETSRAEWDRSIRRVDTGEIQCDASDNVVSVSYVSADGRICYSHENLFDLEPATNFDSKEEENLMKSISELLRGKEMLWNYHYYLEQYVNSMK